MTDKPRPRAKKPSNAEFLRVVEVAEILRVHRQTVYKAIDAGDIPVVKIAGAVRIPSAWLRAAGLKTP